METLWFGLIAFMLTVYAVLDGYDLGTGIVHLGVARNDKERQIVLETIGPLWDGNEVWLIAAGGTLYFAFPMLYAASFSGFYLPLMIVLWLLIFRGIAIEFRGHIDSPVWKPVWDGCFTVASALLAIFLGAALGNVIRGVPLNESREFFLPLWTHFRTTGDPGILDWYTITVGLFVYLALTLHGALWVVFKTHDPIRARAYRIAKIAWWGVAALMVVTTAMTWVVQPQVSANLSAYPIGWLLPVIALAGLAGTFWFNLQQRDAHAFLASSVFLAGMLASAAFGVFPYVLPSNGDPALGLTAAEAAAPVSGLQIGLMWWIPGMILASGYSIYTHLHFREKVS